MNYTAGTRVLWRMGGDGPPIPAVIVHVHSDGTCSVATRHGGALTCEDEVPAAHLSHAPRTPADVLAHPEPGDEIQWGDGTVWRVVRQDAAEPARVWFSSDLGPVYAMMPQQSFASQFNAVPHTPGPLRQPDTVRTHPTPGDEVRWGGGEIWRVTAVETRTHVIFNTYPEGGYNFNVDSLPLDAWSERDAKATYLPRGQA